VLLGGGVAIVLLIAARHMPESADPKAAGPLDWPGAALVTFGLAGVAFALIETIGELGVWFALVNALPLPPLTGGQLLAALMPQVRDAIRRYHIIAALVLAGLAGTGR
jgi:Zn-dependent protease